MHILDKTHFVEGYKFVYFKPTDMSYFPIFGFKLIEN